MQRRTTALNFIESKCSVQFSNPLFISSWIVINFVFDVHCDVSFAFVFVIPNIHNNSV